MVISFGDFQYSTDQDSGTLLRQGVFSCYRPVTDQRPYHRVLGARIGPLAAGTGSSRTRNCLTPDLCVVHICVTHSYGGSAAMSTDRSRRTIDQQLPLRGVEFHILLSLAAGERHGYGIIRDIEARGDGSVPDLGTMYRALARMAEGGLIEAAARRRAADAGDERRNYYRITDAGRRVARAEAQRLEALTQAARIGGLLPRGAK